jgi:hypothetical protein
LPLLLIQNNSKREFIPSKNDVGDPVDKWLSSLRN